MLMYLIGVTLLIMAYRQYRDIMEERHRQALFTLRDELFDFWATTGMPFSHPAYTLRRSALNGAIRFAHDRHMADLIGLVLAYWTTKRTSPRTWGLALKANEEKATAQIESDDVRSFLATWDHCRYRCPGGYMLASSVTGWLTFAVLFSTLLTAVAIYKLAGMSARSSVARNAEEHAAGVSYILATLTGHANGNSHAAAA